MAPEAIVRPNQSKSWHTGRPTAQRTSTSAVSNCSRRRTDGGGPRRGVRLLTHSSQLKVPGGPRYPHQNDYSSSCDLFGACTSGAVRCAEMPPQMCSAHAVEQQRRRGAEASGAGTAVARVHPQDGGRNRTRKEVSIHEWQW